MSIDSDMVSAYGKLPVNEGRYRTACEDAHKLLRLYDTPNFHGPVYRDIIHQAMMILADAMIRDRQDESAL